MASNIFQSRLVETFWRSLQSDSFSISYEWALTSTGRRLIFDDSYVGAFLLCISCSVLSQAGPRLQGYALFQNFRSRPHQLRRVGLLQSPLWDRLWSLLLRVAQRRSSCERVSGENVLANEKGDPSQRAPHRNRVQEPSSLSIDEHVGKAREIT